MEMKVWVEGLPKTVCGISEETTCQDIVKALAHATGIRGRFLLVERFGQSEKPVAPSDHLLHLLQQKGDHSHAVQFILRKTDPLVSSVARGSLSPPTTVETPFQRPLGKNGNLRKSLTFHAPQGAQGASGKEFSVPKIIKTRGNFLLEQNGENFSSEKNGQISALIKENNLPSDLINAEKSKENEDPKGGPTDPRGGQPDPQGGQPLVPVTPYGSEVSLQVEEIKLRNGHGRQGSLDDQLTYRTAHNLTHATDHGKNAEGKSKEKKKQLSVEIRQQKEHMILTQADEMHFDRELKIWEEKLERIIREEESLDASLQPLRNSEKNVIFQLKEFSNLQLEEILRINRKAEEAVKNELFLLRSKIVQCQENINNAESKARFVAEQIQIQRDSQKNEKNFQIAETKTFEQERDRLAKELQHLAVIQENQTRRLENIALNEQRMESTLLAKQLELDSLQVSLKKANFDGFLGGLSVKSSIISPDPLPDSESERIMTESSEENGGKPESQPSPAAPARRATSSQRILVLKRNSTRDPQGMWV